MFFHNYGGMLLVDPTYTVLRRIGSSKRIHLHLCSLLKNISGSRIIFFLMVTGIKLFMQQL